MLRIVVGSMALVALFLNVAMAATNHTVGAPKGSWDENTNLAAWSKAQTFSVGDNLVFQYAPAHDVMEVSKSDYDSCATKNAMVTDNGGLTVVPLTKAGSRYFICGTPGHCTAGMKLAVNVVSAASTSPSSAPTLAVPGDISPSTTVMPPVRSPFGGVAGSPVRSPFGGVAGSPEGLATPSSPSSASRSGALSGLVAFVVGAAAILAF